MLNEVTLIGNLGKDPEVKRAASGMSVCTIHVATTETWKDKDGTKQEHTEWHRCVAFGRTAELVGQYLTKGRQVWVRGRIRTEKWTDRDNVDRWSTTIRIDSIRFLNQRAGLPDPRPEPGDATGEFGGFNDDVPF